MKSKQYVTCASIPSLSSFGISSRLGNEREYISEKLPRSISVWVRIVCFSMFNLSALSIDISSWNPNPKHVWEENSKNLKIKIKEQEKK